MDDEFISRLAQPRPDPGGAGAAAHCALVALALLEKIILLEFRRKENSPERLSFWKHLLDKARTQSGEILRLREEDSRAYLSLSRARSTPDSSSLRQAFIYATECPVKIVEEVCTSLDLVMEAGSQCRKHLRSDLLVAVELLSGAGKAVGHIAFQNLELMPRNDDAERLSEELEKNLSKLHRIAREAIKVLSAGSPVRE